ncbi:MAG: NADH-quinone oxidoreductase subunit J [Parachlamydiaceae bacterium]
MNITITILDGILGVLLLISALGTVFLKQPVHSCLSFLVSLLALSAIYVTLSAEFIGVMQVLIYAGAILVLFMFVIVLFQDAHHEVYRFLPRSPKLLMLTALIAFGLALLFFEWEVRDVQTKDGLTAGYGRVESLGRDLYLQYFFPFEAMLPLFLAAIVGSVYIARRRS